MYFWKIDSLKKDLIENGLSQKSLFIYILLYVLVAQVFAEFSYFFPAEAAPGTMDYLQIAIDLIAIGIGTYLCYYANGANNGEQFAERFFSIGFVIGIRFMALLIPIMMVYGIIVGVIASTTEVDTEGTFMNASVLILIFSWIVAMYWRFIVHINDVAKSANA